MHNILHTFHNNLPGYYSMIYRRVHELLIANQISLKIQRSHLFTRNICYMFDSLFRNVLFKQVGIWLGD